MQMGVTGCKLCYSFVWMPHGNELVFNLDFWNDIVLLFYDFHDLYLYTITLLLDRLDFNGDYNSIKTAIFIATFSKTL